MAKAGQMDAVKIMAKDLVRTRKAIKKFMLMKQEDANHLTNVGGDQVTDELLHVGVDSATL